MPCSPDAGWRLLPSERALWQGRPRPGTPSSSAFRWTALLVLALCAVAACFAALLSISELPGARSMAFTSAYLALLGLGLHFVPRYLLHRCEYLLTDRRMLLRRGALRRSLELPSITFARIRWHPSVCGVGSLELVCATPFGPLGRGQRIMLHDVIAPDAVLALVRGCRAGAHAGQADLCLSERLEEGERVQWGASPEGWLLGWSDVATAVLGTALLATGVGYGLRVGGLLLRLEDNGLRVQSWTWLFLFLAVAISCSAILTVGVSLLWHGLWGARALGRATEYILTDRRLLIRRGRTELSIDRRRIVDAAEVPCMGGLHNLFLILDSPHARALADSGALGPVAPLRASVPPVLYELSDTTLIRDLLFKRNAAQALAR